MQVKIRTNINRTGWTFFKFNLGNTDCYEIQQKMDSILRYKMSRLYGIILKLLFII